MTQENRKPQKDDQQVRQALRRFFGTVDEALRAAEAARQAREELERLTGKQLAEARR
jgi:hypothetical protein